MFRYRMILTYDGTAYFGWQANRDIPTIEKMMQQAVHQITNEYPSLEAASRTDRGVHAQGQVVGCTLNKEWQSAALLRGLNGCLPLDIRVTHVEPVPLTFHPSLDALEKIYIYQCCLGIIQKPEHRLYSWHIHQPIDPELIEQEIPYLLGKHDFRAFCNLEPNRPVCHLKNIHISYSQDRLKITLHADRFLYRMARNLAGSLIDIGKKKLPQGALQYALQSKRRSLAGVSAPAHGLLLYRIYYS